MQWRSPAAFVGEFDAMEGPKVNYCFEYYTYFNDISYCPTASTITFVEGECLVTRRVASGPLKEEMIDYMRSVASRALSSNGSGEETMLFQESGCPAVASVSFSLSDILARGEKRRFCLVYLHPVYADLISRWSLLASASRLLIDLWSLAVDDRYRVEYASFSNLEERREVARTESLRSLMLLLDPNGDESIALRKVHAFFECALPLIFRAPVAYRCDEEEKQRKWLWEHIDQQCMMESSINVSIVESGAVVKDFSTTIEVRGEGNIRPLALWLISSLQNANDNMGLVALLSALLSGNQIIIYGDDPKNAADLALALTHTLPTSLTKTKLWCDEYIMPYEGRIVSFSERFAKHFIIVPRPTRARHGEQEEFPLSDIAAEGVICVRVAAGVIDSVYSCDQYREGALCETGAPSPGIFSVVRRLLSLVASTQADTSSVRLLHTQIRQLVHEYVLRGRVYRKLYIHQEVTANKAILSGAASLSSNGSSFLSRPRRPSGLHLFALPEYCTTPKSSSLTKSSSLHARRAGKYVSKQSLFSFPAAEDHPVFMFLGSASER